MASAFGRVVKVNKTVLFSERVHMRYNNAHADYGGSRQHTTPDSMTQLTRV